MKPTLLLPAAFLLAFPLAGAAQSSSVNLHLNTGIFKYVGETSFETTGISSAPFVHTQLPGAPGRRPGFSFEVAGSWNRVSKTRFLLGAELAFQSLQSHTTVVARSASPISSSFTFAKGETSLTSRFICFTPLAGYRVLDKQLKLDLSAGLEMAACVSREEKIDAYDVTASDVTYKGTNKLARRPDYRIRFQLNSSIGKIGVNTGYVAGISNYYGDDEAPQFKAWSRFIRLGLSYRLTGK